MSLNRQVIPSSWKKSQITMIQKKDNNRNDPLNYRSISITLLVGKLCEKLVYKRSKQYLNNNNFQSGFRQHCQTKDNICNLIQQIKEIFQ